LIPVLLNPVFLIQIVLNPVLPRRHDADPVRQTLDDPPSPQ